MLLHIPTRIHPLHNRMKGTKKSLMMLQSTHPQAQRHNSLKSADSERCPDAPHYMKITHSVALETGRPCCDSNQFHPGPAALARNVNRGGVELEVPLFSGCTYSVKILAWIGFSGAK
jgi:hypothetical protein